ncbi:MAG: helix-turn-helix transcriptional regulator [Bdellovibrionales bacterium]|nr:helix-turn-helix transcriptional regulator [Bdellovibrionales bacterium]
MKSKSYKSAKDFAKDFGLSDVEIALVKEKKKLIEKLIAKRDKLNLSQAAVAKLIGSKQPAIARMESGQVSEVSMDFLVKVAMALKVTISIKANAAA